MSAKNRANYGAEHGAAVVVGKTVDFNRRVIAAILALVFVLTSVVVGWNFVAKGEDAAHAPALAAATSGSNLVLDKTISVEEDGTYTLKLSAYAKGKIKDVTEQIPTDFILVLDQSGSMKTVDMPTEYVAANNGASKNWQMDDFENQALYVKDETQDNTYYRVYRKRGVLYEYQEPDSIYVQDVLNNLRWFQGETEQEQSTASQYYFRPSDLPANPADGAGLTKNKTGEFVDVSADDNFYHVDISSSGSLGYYSIKFSYDSKDSNRYYFVHPNKPIYKNPLGGKYRPGDGLYDQINGTLLWYFNDARCYSYGKIGLVNTGMYIRQPLYIRHASYSQLCYKDSNGIEHKLINTPYCDADGNPLGGACTLENDGRPAENQTSTKKAYWNGILYQPAANAKEERLISLNKALKAFIDATAEQSDDYGKVDHRIAMVGFSSTGYSNTELLTGVPIDSSSKMSSEGSSLDGYEHNGPQYGGSASISDNVYKTTLLSTADADSVFELKNAADYITAYGGTQPALGLEMAKKIIDTREVTTYTRKSTNTTEPRRTVVIFFTDGTPGNYSTIGGANFSNQYQEADKVVKAANDIKTDSNTNTLIYSIGVFGESDGNPLIYQKTTNTGSKESNVDDALDSSMTEEDFSPYLAQVNVSTSRSGNGKLLNPYQYTTTRKYYFREHAEGVAGYPAQPNDTIADYMEVVSSKYPEAKSFVYFDNKNSYSSYNSRIDAARGTTIDTSQRYYFMASDSASLSKVFAELSTSISESGVGLDLNENNSCLQDVVSNNFVLPNNLNNHVTAKTYVGTQEENEEVPTFSTDSDEIIASDNIHCDGNTVRVFGFNYSDNYIAVGKPGKKIVVTIAGLIPKEEITGDNLASNLDTSGIIHIENIDETPMSTAVAKFVSPTISRWKYALNVSDIDRDAIFNLQYQLAPENIEANPQAVVLRGSDGGQRLDTLANNTLALSTVGNNATIYAEYITAHGKDGTVDPADYSLTASVVPASADAGKYTYYLDTADYVDLASPDETKLLPLEGRVETLSTTTNGNLYVDSIANNHQVTIKETVNGSFANESDTFTPTLYLVPPAGTTVPSSETYGETTWTKDGESNRLVFTPSAIRGDNAESLILTVPVGWTLQVAQVDDNHYDVTHMEYIASTAGARVRDITTDKSFVVTDDVTVTITNTRDNIPVTGMTSSDNQTLVYILSGAGVLALAAGGYYVWKKKDEFVED